MLDWTHVETFERILNHKRQYHTWPADRARDALRNAGIIACANGRWYVTPKALKVYRTLRHDNSLTRLQALAAALQTRSSDSSKP